jgi:carboxypeptidase family protein
LVKQVLITLLIAAGCAIAQNQPSQVAPGSVQGRITDSQTGIGLGGVTVRLLPRRSPNATQPSSTVSLDGGGFRFDSVVPGTYALFANKSGYQPQTSSQLISVAERQQVTDIALQLNPLGILAGKVRDNAGHPVPKATVHLFAKSNARGGQRATHISTTADATGKYRFEKVMPGEYYVAADPPSTPVRSHGSADGPQQDQPAAESSGIGMVRTFYPRAARLDGASVVEVTAGSSLDSIDIRLALASLFSISGKVDGFQSGSFVRSAMLNLTPRDALPASPLGLPARLNRDGSFLIDKVQSGAYTLWLMGSFGADSAGNRRLGRRRVLAREDLDVSAGNVNGLVLALMPPVNLSGQIVLQNPATNVDPAQLRLTLQPAGPGNVGSYQTLTIDGNGTFSAQDLEPGRYTVQISNKPAGMYIQSITLNHQDVTSSGIDFSQGGGGELQVTLKSGAAEVDGTLSGNDAQQTATGVALLVPESILADGSGVLVGNVRTGGIFSIQNVPPGRYLAFAVPQWSSIWQNPDFQREMQRAGTPVEVQENAQAHVELRLLSADDLESAASRLGLTSQ